MNRTISILSASLALGSLTACADKVDASQSTNFTLAATDDACTVSGAEATTGTSTFEVTNNGEKTTEFYVYTSGGRVVGEVENIGPGATRKLVVQITDPGDYTLTCKPGMVGDGFSQTLKVTGEAMEPPPTRSSPRPSTDTSPTSARRPPRYRARSTHSSPPSSPTKSTPRRNSSRSRAPHTSASNPWRSPSRTTSTRASTCARPTSRRATPGPASTRSNKDLWVNKKITDETKASGAQGLLDEIATSKITGEEDIFSRTDLYDFQANLDGSRAAIASLEKALNERDPQLLTDIHERFDAVQTLLDTYREGDGFVSYDKVSQDERRELSDALDVLTEKVSTVQEVVAS